MKKYQKLLVTCALVSLPVIQSANATNLSFKIKGVNIVIENIRSDFIEGIEFDAVIVDGKRLTVEQMRDARDDEIITLAGRNFTVAKLKEMATQFDERFTDDVIAQIKLSLEAQNITPDERKEIISAIEQNQAERQDVVNTGHKKSSRRDAIKTVQSVVIPMIYGVTSQVLDMVDTRVDTIDSGERLAANQGIAAGEIGDEFKHGIWIKGNVSKDRYKKTSNRDKLSIATAGTVLGYDLKINDNIMAGLAFGYQNSSVDIFKNNDVKLHTLVGAAYGRYTFDMPIFINANYSYSASHFTDKQKSVYFKSIGFNNFHTLGTEVGYNHAISRDVEITPTAGIKHIAHDWRVGKKWFDSRDAKAKNGSATYATLGLKLKSLIENESFNIMPYVSVGIDSRIAHKKTKLTLTSRGGKPKVEQINVGEKQRFTAGTGLTAKFNKTFSASLGYKYTKAKVHNSHAGTLGLRFDF